MIGERIGPYEILEPLGEGGMGVVYKARDTRLDRLVALKFLSPALQADASAEARFEQEAKTASALEHPNICTIHDLGTTPDGRKWIAMAYYEGHPLDHLLDAGKLTPDRASELVLQVAEGLAKAHRQGIVHRDIKPSNLFLTEDGVVKILDFGLAKMGAGDGLTQTGSSLGTPSYMAPEQVRGETVDSRADVWAIGVLLYSMLADRPPFREDSLEGTMYAVLEKDPVPLGDLDPDIDPELVGVVERCLMKDREDRFPNAGAVAASLKVWMGFPVDESVDATVVIDTGSGSRTAMVPSRRRTRRKRRRSGPGFPWKKVLGWGAGLAVLGVVTIAVVQGRLWEKAPPPPIRVAVMAPAMNSSADSVEIARVTSAVEMAVVRGLIPVPGVSVVEARGVSSIPMKVAEILGTDEVLESRVVELGSEWNIRLTRLDATGATLWMSDFKMPRDADLDLANTVVLHLAAAYPERGGTGTDGFVVAPADFQEFLELRATLNADRSGVDDGEFRSRLEALIARSPGFEDAYLLAATFHIRAFDVNRDAERLDAAAAAAERAADLAPDDPRPPRWLLEIALRRQDWEAAEAHLAEIERLRPGSVEVLTGRAHVAAGKGDDAGAVELMTRARERGIPRVDLYYLAYWEYRLGRSTEALGHLRELLDVSPDYTSAKALAAQIELLQGSVGTAEALFGDLIADAPSASRYSNRGLARMLLQRYPAAVEDFDSALRMAPREPSILLNLADAYQAMGRKAEADSLYGRILAGIEADPQADLVDNRVMKAQCLAHLGRELEAVEVAQDLVARDADNPEARYAASLVYCVTGERTSAVVNAEAALRAGMEARWFDLPWFAPLRNDARFRSLLEAGNPAS